MGNDLIGFRDVRSRDEWCTGCLDPKLSMIFLQAANYYTYTLKGHLLVTSIYRTPEEDEALGGHGIHPLWRAIDIHADTWDDPKITQLADFVNTRWIYDPLRMGMKVALWEPHGSGPHLHLQVNAATMERPPANSGQLARQQETP